MGLDSVIGETAKITTISGILAGHHSVLAQHDDFEPSPFVFPCGRTSAIAYMDNVFDGSMCQDLIQYCESHQSGSKVGRTMGGVNLRYKVSRDWHLTTISEDAKEREDEKVLDSFIFHRLWKIIDIYKGTFPALMLPDSINHCMGSDTGYQIQKYTQNSGFYNPHIDGSPWLPSSVTRTLGVIIYLNTVEVGGGTNFPLHQTIVDAVQGRVAMFPAYWTHLHEGLMPLSSDKWIISTFVNCSNGVEMHGEDCTCFDGEEEMGGQSV